MRNSGQNNVRTSKYCGFCPEVHSIATTILFYFLLTQQPFAFNLQTVLFEKHDAVSIVQQSRPYIFYHITSIYFHFNILLLYELMDWFNWLSIYISQYTIPFISH